MTINKNVIDKKNSYIILVSLFKVDYRNWNIDENVHRYIVRGGKSKSFGERESVRETERERDRETERERARKREKKMPRDFVVSPTMSEWVLEPRYM